MSTKKKQAAAPSRHVHFRTQTPTIAMLSSALTERGYAVPVPATRASLLAALLGHGCTVGYTDSIVPLAAKARYEANGGSCGDALAAAFAATDPALWPTVAKQNGIDFNRWSHLNNGQQRMNLSNVLRGKLRRGESVVVGDETFGAAE